MFKAGIVDPTKVTRSALQNAACIAGLMLTTEVMVTKIDEDEPKQQGRRRGPVIAMPASSRATASSRGSAIGVRDLTIAAELRARPSAIGNRIGR